jgi:hypothetical protein
MIGTVLGELFCVEPGNFGKSSSGPVDLCQRYGAIQSNDRIIVDCQKPIVECEYVRPGGCLFNRTSPTPARMDGGLK